MILAPSQSIWTLGESRFGAWWRRAKEWRASISTFMAEHLQADSSTGHLKYKATGGHLTYCPGVACSCCSGGVGPSTVTATVSGVVMGTCCGSAIFAGGIDGTYNVPSDGAGSCSWSMDLPGTVAETTYLGGPPNCVTVDSGPVDLTPRLHILCQTICSVPYWVCHIKRRAADPDNSTISYFFGRIPKANWDCTGSASIGQEFTFCTNVFVFCSPTTFYNGTLFGNGGTVTISA